MREPVTDVQFATGALDAFAETYADSAAITCTRRPEPGADGPVAVYVPVPGMGDLVWHAPLIRGIARETPEGSVVLAARPSAQGAALFRYDPAVSRVVEAPRRRGLGRQLEAGDAWRLFRRERPRAVWVLHDSTRPAFAAWAAGVPERRGFGAGRRGQEAWLSPGPRLPRHAAHRLDVIRAFGRLYGLRMEPEPVLEVGAPALDAVERRFERLPKPWLVFGVGATMPDRVWPPERFALVAALTKDDGSAFFIGGRNEAAELRAVAEQVEGAVALAGEPMDEVMALIRSADVFVGVDSGPMNVAAAVATPTVAVFGPTLLTHSRNIRPVRAPSGDIRDVAPEQVAQAVRDVLRS